MQRGTQLCITLPRHSLCRPHAGESEATLRWNGPKVAALRQSSSAASARAKRREEGWRALTRTGHSKCKVEAEAQSGSSSSEAPMQPCRPPALARLAFALAWLDGSCVRPTSLGLAGARALDESQIGSVPPQVGLRGCRVGEITTAASRARGGSPPTLGRSGQPRECVQRWFFTKSRSPLQPIAILLARQTLVLSTRSRTLNPSLLLARAAP